jgi:flagellar basal-body rod modification protein FlgD
VIDPLSTATGTPSATTQTPRADALGRDTFLRLLTTQLAHQDPMQPQADGEFIAQLATFSSLEQLTQIQKSLDRIGAALGVPTDDAGDSTEQA